MQVLIFVIGILVICVSGPSAAGMIASAQRGELRIGFEFLEAPELSTSTTVPADLSVELSGEVGPFEFWPQQGVLRVLPLSVQLRVSGVDLYLNVDELTFEYLFSAEQGGFLTEEWGGGATTEFHIGGIQQDLDGGLPPFCRGTGCNSVIGGDGRRSYLHRFLISTAGSRQYVLDGSPAAVSPVLWDLAPMLLQTIPGNIPVRVDLKPILINPTFAVVPEPPYLVFGVVVAVRSVRARRRRLTPIRPGGVKGQ